MRIVDVSFFYDEKFETAEQQLQQHYTTVGWAEALQRKGTEVIVLKRFSKESSFQMNGVQYHFLKDSYKGNIKSWQFSFKFLKKIVSLNPDIVHLHNFNLSLQNFLLRILHNKKTAIVIQHHGGPYPKGLKKSVHDRLNSVADGFFFTTVEQGKQWFKSKKLHQKIMPVMEGSTFFNYDTRDNEKSFDYNDRIAEKKITGINGQTVFLWVGRLDKNKDPLTVLDGFEILFHKNQDGALYMIFREDDLINDVKRKIINSDILRSRVHVLGKIQHEEIENYYNSSDYFVLGSHYEGSGYALSEALRCGCVPIVTNIPSFRMMTDEGKLGALWEPGNKNSFAEAANIALSKPLLHEGKACIDFFKNNLSFDAIAETAMSHYQKIIERRLQKIHKREK